MYSKILIAYDGSPASMKALEAGAELSKKMSSNQVDVIHVTPIYYSYGTMYTVTTEPEEFAQNILAEAKQRLSTIANVHFIVRTGSVAKNILDYADESKCDLIIVGSRGHTALGEFVLGSVSHNVLQHAKVPVLVIK